MAVHRRMDLACAAARNAGLPGRFRVWRESGLLAVSVTSPALGFLSTITGVDAENLTAAIDLATQQHDVRPTIVGPPQEAASTLTAAGFTQVSDRGLAVRDVSGEPEQLGSSDVVPAGSPEEFVRVLLAGYRLTNPVDAEVSAFIAAEHRHPDMLSFFVIDSQGPIAAGAMSIHGDVAMLGGAATLPDRRGSGAQSRLLRHRLRVAAEKGCVTAVSTMVPDSASARNLRRAGFVVSRRSAWRPPAE
jgi:GNAT superfamily N-acetyltransferase